jgi:hypothetical protein
MAKNLTASLVVSYGGKGGPRSGHIREGRRGVANPQFSFQASETPPLRLNSDLGLRFSPEFLANVPTNGGKLTYLRQEIAGALDQFSTYQHKFLDRYFAFIVDGCDNSAGAIDTSLSWSGGLFSANDFIFSALWPLPDCVVSRSTDAGSEPVGNFDFAFWSGRQLITVTLSGASNRQDDTEVSDKMISGLVHRVTIGFADLNATDDLFTEQRFPPELIHSWCGETVPSSPFRPEGISHALEGEL